MAPDLNLWIVARGINIGLHTRMYFSDQQAANESDPVLNFIDEEMRCNTLIDAAGATRLCYINQVNVNFILLASYHN